jgi:mycothione reductase
MGMVETKEYDLIVIGSGSAMNIVEPMIQENPKIKVAVIDKDEPGGICLTRGCIPSKIMLYPAELVRTMEEAKELGIEAEIKKVDFEKIMNRMRSLIDMEISAIGKGLSESKNIDYYHATAEFVSPYTLKVSSQTIRGKTIFLATGSRPLVPPIKGLERVRYHTSDSVIRMKLKSLPDSIAIVGGGYIAAEFGHFFSAMGSRVTIVGRNPRLLPKEEPEVSSLAKRELGKHMTILTDHEVVEVEPTSTGKRLVAIERRTGQSRTLEAEEIVVAAGRASVNDVLHPERSNVRTTADGWIDVDEYLQTSQPNIWALGDSDGRHLFKHVANYESEVVYYNAVLKRKVKVDYHAIPHAVFTYPEIAAVGMGEQEALEKYGKQGVLIGIQRYEDTAKGEAMNVKDYFVKVILLKETSKILGSHIIGPYASILIQEVIDLMYTADQSARPVMEAMHIHPSLSEVVQRAFGSLTDPDEYHHLLEHHYGLAT